MLFPSHKPSFPKRLLLVGLAMLLAACQPSLAAPTTLVATGPAVVLATAAPQLDAMLLDLPVWGGAVWVYTYTEYEPSPRDPSQVITATYLFTDTVMMDGQISPVYVAHLRHEESPVHIPADWPSPSSSRPAEWWYVVTGNRIYQSFQPLDFSHIKTDTLTLAYDLPLAPGKSWCPDRSIKGQPVTDCTAAGQRTVVSQGSYGTPAGQFDDCFQIAEDYNSGGVTRWLCRGVGLAAQAYDHAGTRFGFTQILISSRPGSF